MPLAGSYDIAYAVAVQADGGKPIVAGRKGGTDTGMYVMRLDPSQWRIRSNVQCGWAGSRRSGHPLRQPVPRRGEVARLPA